MHQTRFRLRLRPRPRWRSLQHSPDPLAGYKGAYIYGKGRKDGREWLGRERREGRRPTSKARGRERGRKEEGMG